MRANVGRTSERRPITPPPAESACFAAQTAALDLVGAGRRPSSAAIYRRDVAEFLDWWCRDPAEAGSGDIIEYLADCGAASPAASDRRLAALAHFFRTGIAAGRWKADPTLGLPRARRQKTP